MNFFQAVASFFRNYAVFKGRSSRSEYWYPILLNILIIFVLPTLAIIYIPEESRNAAPLLVNITVGYVLGAIIPTLAVTARRLHDINLSGWWQLIQVVPFLNLIMLILCVIAGDAEDNRFGSNPASKAADSATS